jgi:hypothetical protein
MSIKDYKDNDAITNSRHFTHRTDTGADSHVVTSKLGMVWVYQYTMTFNSYGRGGMKVVKSHSCNMWTVHNGKLLLRTWKHIWKPNTVARLARSWLKELDDDTK